MRRAWELEIYQTAHPCGWTSQVTFQPRRTLWPRERARPKTRFWAFHGFLGFLRLFSELAQNPPKTRFWVSFDPKLALKGQIGIFEFFPEKPIFGHFWPFLPAGTCKKAKNSDFPENRLFRAQSHSWVKIDPKRRFSRSNWP